MQRPRNLKLSFPHFSLNTIYKGVSILLLFMVSGSNVTIIATEFFEKKPPTCKVFIQSVQHGAEFPLQDIQFTIALVDTSGALVDAITDIDINFSLATPEYRGREMTNGSDFTPITQSITISAGQSSAVIRIPVINDDDKEGPELLRLTLESLISGTTDGNTISTVADEKTKDAYIIDDDDESEATFSFSKIDYNVTIAIPKDINRGTLPSCFTKINHTKIPELLPTAKLSASTTTDIEVFLAYDEDEILKAKEGNLNSAGKYTMRFYARSNLWQKTGSFTLLVEFADPLSFNSLNVQEENDGICNTTYRLPIPGIKTNPSCNRTFDLESIIFNRPTEVTLVNALRREYIFPYGVTTGTYKIKEIIENCEDCVVDEPIEISFSFKRNNIGEPVIDKIPDLEVMIEDKNTCEIMLDPKTLVYQGEIGCEVTNVVPNLTALTKFSKGESSIVYSLTNTVTGNTVTATQKLIVKDRVPPTVPLPIPQVTVLTLLDTCQYMFKKDDFISQITATDNCSNILSFQFFANEDAPLEIGTHSIAFKVTDQDNNASSQQTLRVKVIPNQPSQVTDFAKDKLEVTLDFGESEKSIFWDDPMISSCYKNIEPIRSHQPNDSFMAGKYQVSYTYSFPSQSPVIKSFELIVNPSKGFKDIKLYKIITPNGDGINDVWHIDNIENYSENSVMIYDDFGYLVYDENNYNNKEKVWKGHRQNSNQILPNGIYYYTIFLRPIGETIKGSVMIVTANE